MFASRLAHVVRQYPQRSSVLVCSFSHIFSQNLVKSRVPIMTTAQRGFKSIYKNPKTYTQKTKKGALKRFIVTGSGGIKCKHAGKGHLAQTKNSIRARRLNQKKMVVGRYHQRMKELILTSK